MKATDLSQHTFTHAVFAALQPAMVAEYEFEQENRGTKYVPNEYEFYLFRVGTSLARLLAHCEQLEHTLAYFSTFRETPAARRAGATKQKYLRSIDEGYIVRTQTTYDLALMLTDAVFHLTNAEPQCREATILQNLKVSRTNTPKILKKLKKRLRRLTEARNVVVHRGGYHDDELDRMELYAELEDSYLRMGKPLPADMAFVPGARTVTTRDFMHERKRQYVRLNTAIFNLVSDILDTLHLQFIEEEQRIRALV